MIFVHLCEDVASRRSERLNHLTDLAAPSDKRATCGGEWRAAGSNRVRESVLYEQTRAYGIVKSLAKIYKEKHRTPQKYVELSFRLFFIPLLKYYLCRSTVSVTYCVNQLQCPARPSKNSPRANSLFFREIHGYYVGMT